MNRRLGFSLIELLIVLFIVMALISLVLACAVGARAAAQRTACAANLAQIGRLTQVYANENGGWILRNGNVSEQFKVTHRPWLAMVDRSFVNLSLTELSRAASRVMILKCPAHPAQATPSSFVANAFVVDDADVPEGLLELAGPTKLAKIKDSSNVIFLTDLVAQYWWRDQDVTQIPDEEAEFWMAILDVWQSSMLPGIDGESSDRIATNRHGVGRVNALFFDGSVRSVESLKLTPKDFDDHIRSRVDRLIVPREH